VGAGPSEPQTLRLVVTVQKTAPDELIGPGDVVAEVSGRPVFAVPPGMPFYRNLDLGAEGADVDALQGFLGATGHFEGKASGEFDPRTLAGLRSLYEDAGYGLPLADGVEQGFVLDEFAEVAAEPVRVIEAAAAGARVDNGTPLIRVVIGEPWVSARVTILDAEALPEGAEVALTAAGAEPLPATVGSVGEYQSEGTPGYDLTVPVPVEWFEAVGDSQQVAVEPTGQVPVGPAVPTTAVREDGNGTYVLAAGSDAAGFDRVPITVTGQVGGYTLIAADEALPIGRRIVVSGGGAAGA
jgi:hypothetical protein